MVATEERQTKRVDESARERRGIIAKGIAWALRLSVVRAVLHYTAHRGATLADSVTYRALFSVFAGVLLLFSAAAVWLAGNPEAMQALVGALDSFVPGLSDAIDPARATVSVGFSVVGVISLVGLVVAALSAIESLRIALRVIADAGPDETFVLWTQLRNAAVGLCLVGLLFVAAATSIVTSSGLAFVADLFGVSDRSALFDVGSRVIGVVAALVINTVAIALAFRLLAGVRVPARALWLGAGLGGVGLLVLQEFSALFVRGATSNPLLASFASLIAILLWINLSTQVMLVSASLTVVLEARARDRVGEIYGAETFAQLRRRSAAASVARATRELRAAEAAETAERERLAKR